MISIRIAGVVRKDGEIDAQWINQEINRRRADGQSPCVIVTINDGDVNMTLSTPNCSGGAGGGRAPNRHEQELFDLWAKLKLNTLDFASGQVVAFYNHLRH